MPSDDLILAVRILGRGNRHGLDPFAALFRGKGPLLPWWKNKWKLVQI